MPRAPATVILERPRREGYPGGITVLKDHLIRLRPSLIAAKARPRTSYLPGEIAQGDWWHTGARIPVCGRRATNAESEVGCPDITAAEPSTSDTRRSPRLLRSLSLFAARVDTVWHSRASNALVPAVAAFLFVACTAGSASPPSATRSVPSTTPTGTAPSTIPPTSSPSIHPSPSAKSGPLRAFNKDNFADPSTWSNRWLPLRPGSQTVRNGSVNVGHRTLEHIRVFTVTDVYKRIDGVNAVAVIDQDLDGGEIAEQALDFVAEDKQGNVWYFGSYTEAYEGGQFVSAPDGWLAGLNGETPGVWMLSQPHVGASYPQQPAAGDISNIVKTRAHVCVPYGCFDDVVVVSEGGGSEFKSSAPGVGGIKTEPASSDPAQEKELLVNIKQLSPSELTKLSNEVLSLDRNARGQYPDVFGRSQAAKRMP
jgi:hypothetical protein